MSLQFAVDDLISPLVSLSYLSSEEEDMEVDDPQAAVDEEGYDSDIEVLACFSESQSVKPMGVAGRTMTTETYNEDDDLTLVEELYGRACKVDSEPTDDLVNLVLGNGPPNHSMIPVGEKPIARCAQMQPIPDTPQSPPAHERGPTSTFDNTQWANFQTAYEPEHAHITGIAVSASGVCRTSNFVARGDCVVCGNDFGSIKEEVTLDYLERTHLSGESYLTRVRRRNAFEAGMAAGSFLLVPGGVSQAPACDGNWYQVAPDTCNNLPVPPGVLPI